MKVAEFPLTDQTPAMGPFRGLTSPTERFATVNGSGGSLNVIRMGAVLLERVVPFAGDTAVMRKFGLAVAAAAVKVLVNADERTPLSLVIPET